MRVRYSFSSRRTRHITKVAKQKAKYPELIKKIVEISDIILEVLDARFIQETRNRELEKEIKKQKKKLIFVLNKADLTNKGAPKSISPRVFISCTKKTGKGELIDLVKKEAKRVEKKTKKMIKGDKVKKIEDDNIIVGVIGYPNTGKSSTINFLTGKTKAKTASEAGYTKGFQKIKLTSEIMLIDSPGVIPEDQYSAEDQEKIAKHTMVGGRSYSQVREPDLIVANIMKEYPNVFEKFYKIDAKGNPEILIEKLGNKKGFLKKGGVVNEDVTARLMLKDWQDGKIRL